MKLEKNKLICGDNLEILSTLDKESVDLIYIDPPFFSNRNYEIIWGDEAEIRSFEDRWEGGINVYIDWMKERVIELHRVLKSTGSFYLHCDWHAGHYLKVMCDEIFGDNNFRNEIIWHYRRWTAQAKSFQKLHDNIFFYTKSENYTFNQLYTQYTEGSIKRKKQGVLHRFKKGEEPVLVSEGTVSERGVSENDVWHIPFVAPSAKERLGYDTQKPEKLLERIVKASSNKGDLVLDAFCGCGTAMAVAEKLGRHWIGIDISPSAITLVKNRLSNIGVREKDIDIIGMPKTAEDLKNYKPHDFQYWVITEMHGTPSPKKAGDMGIDGLSFLNHYPIQVKQSESVGRNVIDNFETALRRYYKGQKKEMRGYIIAFSFGKGAYEEVIRAKKDGIKIELATVQDILDKKFVIKQTLL
ncbi:MAG: DNA methyltransferase [candidate division Zixibacteria bacterium RBG-1]|nr:MAG: DNA methyltransferase [candidate division Zixibacteria bacterium RBG-1]OGC84664.1 MAG: hypothetical protein A2V73_02885 [candidate division Zixibacteria bacterium RBG_19FT_COMBO_42_43]